MVKLNEMVVYKQTIDSPCSGVEAPGSASADRHPVDGIDSFLSRSQGTLREALSSEREERTRCVLAYPHPSAPEGLFNGNSVHCPLRLK
ncbi:hypothetical protein TNCT_406331 [Trichonephila clavata]|uniref:Uncharacterized protein n=1 Tax=Trichonephila clavata TaxID=2740835 RepID=A0A8X6FIN3_TRICU|nr:hypothetical protein TNCT_406331 [Trichonephila clavata]